MSIRSRCLLAALLAAGPVSAQGGATRFSLSGLGEARGTATGREASWLDGGLGKLRLGGDGADRDAELRLPNLALVARLDAGEALTLRVHVRGDADPERTPLQTRVDVVEAFALGRVDVTDLLGLRLKAGVFFPPVSLENDGLAWLPTRTLTPSAVDSWIGEEVRATGAELTARLLLRQSDLALFGAVFGANDPAGTLLAWRGFSLHDRLTGRFEHLPLAPLPSIASGGLFPLQAPWTAPFREVDGRAGWYAGVSYRLPERLLAQALVWDNNGDPTAFDGSQYAWDTAFSAFGVRLTLPARIELLGQLVTGRTRMGPGPAVDVRFLAWYGLATASLGRFRVTARYDAFSADDEDPNRASDPNDEDGHALTASVSFEAARWLSVWLEALRVSSERPARALLGTPAGVQDDQLQLALRTSF